MLQLAVRGVFASPHRKGWLSVRLGDVVESITGGGTPSKNHAAYWGGKIPWASVKDLGTAKYLDRTQDTITKEGLENSSSNLIPEDRIIVCTRMGLGKIAINRIAVAINQDLKALMLKPSVDTDFFYNLYKTLPIEGTGMTVAGIRQAALLDIPIMLPPLAEQKLIVAKVDELMVLCDELEARQEEARKVQARLNQSALARLTQSADFSNDWKIVARNFQSLEKMPENVSELRKTILRSAAEGRLARRSSTTAWRSRPLEDIAVVAGGVTKGRKLGGRKTIALPYLRVANVQRGSLDLSVIKEIAIPEEELERYRLKRDDLLTTEGGDWDKVGRTAMWHDEIPVCLHQNHVFRSRLDQRIACPEWVALVINSPVGREYFEMAAKQTTNLASINMTELRAFPIPLPPLAEQKRIVVKVGELMKLCDELEAQLKRAEADGARLFDAVVKGLTAG